MIVALLLLLGYDLFYAGLETISTGKFTNPVTTLTNGL